MEHCSFDLYSSSLFQTCFIVIVTYLLYSKIPKTSLFFNPIKYIFDIFYTHSITDFTDFIIILFFVERQIFIYRCFWLLGLFQQQCDGRWKRWQLVGHQWFINQCHIWWNVGEKQQTNNANASISDSVQMWSCEMVGNRRSWWFRLSFFAVWIFKIFHYWFCFVKFVANQYVHNQINWKCS